MDAAGIVAGVAIATTGPAANTGGASTALLPAQPIHRFFQCAWTASRFCSLCRRCGCRRNGALPLKGSQTLGGKTATFYTTLYYDDVFTVNMHSSACPYLAAGCGLTVK